MFYCFFIYLFICLAISYAWSDTEVFGIFRNFIAKIPYINKPLLCHECSSFWISLILSIFINGCSVILKLSERINLAVVIHPVTEIITTKTQAEAFT